MTGDRDDDLEERPWHERTSTVVGASVGGLVLLAILFFAGSCVSRTFNEPEQTPQYFLDEPGTSSSTRSSSATTATETVTSTSPPMTTDINPGESTTTSSTSGTDTSTSSTSSSPTTTRTRETESDGPSSTRSRPRLNETRTLYPRP